MVRLFDTSFLVGSVLVVAALSVAFLALTRAELPIVGTGVGALVLVAVIGMAGCAVAGVSQAPALGWTAPVIVLGTVLGIAALVLIAAGIFGWSGILEPIGAFVPGGYIAANPARTAVFALAVLIAAKWVIGIAMAATAR
jgi:hypothetical protein